MGAISKEVATLNAQFTALYAELAKTSQLGNIRALDSIRGTGGQSGMRQLLNDTGAFRVESVKVTSQVESFTKAIQKQDVTINQIRKSGKLLTEVYREQYRIQNMMAAGWHIDANNRVTADMIIPRDVPERVTSLKKSFREASTGAVSWGKVIEEQRMRLGTFSQALQSGATNLINKGKNMQWAGRQLMVGVSLPFAAIGAAAGKMFNDVDQNLTKVTRVYDFSDKIMASAGAKAAATNQLRAQSLDMARQAATLYGASINDTIDSEAQLAAAGQTGNEMFQNTLNIQRASMLGGMDYNKTVETTIALQSTGLAKSAKDVGDAFNYMNSMENGTVLTMSDFTDAVPRIAGILQPLGGSLQDIGLMLTAMKAAAIPATQGANALKSALGSMLVPSSKASKLLEGMGIHLDEITAKNKGNLLPSLTDLASQLEATGATAQKQAEVIYALFGKQQAARIGALISQLRNVNNQATQMGRAFQIGMDGPGKWAITAANELATAQESASFKFKKAINTMKADLAAAGKPFLEFATNVVGFISKILKAFNGLGDGKKKFLMITAGILAMVGPLIMISGLMMNFAGQGYKLYATVLNLASGFKVQGAEQKMAALVAKQATSVFADETMQLKAMRVAIDGVSEALLTQNRIAQNKARIAEGISAGVQPGGNILARTSVKDRKTRYYAQDSEGRLSKQLPADHPDVMAMKQAEESAAKIDTSTASASRNMAGYVSKATGIGFAAGMVGTMVTNSDSLVGKLSEGLTVASMIAMALGPQMLGKGISAVGSMLTGVIGGAGGKIATTFTGIAAKFGGMSAMAGPFGVGLAVAAGSALLIYKHMKNVEQTIKNVAKAGDDMTVILGGTVKKSGEWVDATGKVQQSIVSLGNSFAEKNADSAKSLREAAATAAKGGSDASLRKQVMQIGLDVMTNTGDAEKAKQAVQIALQAAGNPKMYIDTQFTDPDWVAKQRKKVQDDLLNAASTNVAGDGKKKPTFGWQGMPDFDFGMNNTLKANLKKQAEDLGKAYSDALSGAITPEEAKKKYDDTFNNFRDHVRAKVKEMGGSMKTNPIMSNVFSQFKVNPQDNKAIATSLLTNKKFADAFRDNASMAGYSTEEIDNLIKAYRFLGDETAKTTNTQNVQGHDMKNLNNVANSLFGDMEGGANTTKKVGAAASGAAADVSYLQDAMDRAGGSINEWGQKALESSWSTIMDNAKQQYVDAHESAVKAMEKSHKAAQDRLDAEGTVADRAFDTRGKNIEDKYNKAQKSFDSRWKTRIKTETDAYDTRIKKVDDAIKAEQKAEDVRQKIFEAEKARIQRLAEMQNSSIDVNMALGSGNMDEAAKLINNARSTQTQWALDDAQAGQQTGSEQRIEGLNTQKDTLQNAKDKRLDDLKNIQDAEKQAMDDKKKREQDSLAHEKQMYDDALAARKKSLDAQQQLESDAAQKRFDTDQKALDQQLAALQAYVPKNKKEQDAQIAALQALYQQHGVFLNTKSKSWGDMVTKAMKTSAAAAQAAIANDQEWKDLADKAATDITSAFGMTKEEFMAWVTTGKMPAKAKEKQGKIVMRGGQEMWQMPGGKVLAFHTGGHVGSDIGGRAGVSNMNSRLPSEVDTRLKKGEYVVNEHSVNKYGVDFMDAVNKGRLPKATGGGTQLGPAGFIAAATVGIMKSLIRRQMSNAGMAQAGVDSQAQGFESAPGMPGKYGNVSFNATQMQNAASIITTGRSMGASNRDLVVSLMTAMQESNLTNIAGGDRDSVGLFQQRPSQGWGTVAQIMDPHYAATKFFEGLLAIKDRDKMALTEEAQAVQRSAFPNAYAKWEGAARALLEGSTNAGGVVTDNWSAGPGSGLAMPLAGTITSRFGMRTNPVTGQYVLHNGTDIAAPIGTPIHAAAGGTVLRAGPASGYGNWTVLGHSGGMETGYAHQRNIVVAPGQHVNKGQVIGFVGMTGNTTGPHLHFQTGMNGNWSNPRAYIPGLNVGGEIKYDNTIANLHKKETVLTAPLSAELKNGIKNLDQGAGTTYNVTMDLRGAYIKEDFDLEGALDKAMAKKEGRLGVKRKIT